MLDRVLEPEVMDDAQEAADYDAMDHAVVNRRFVDDGLQALATAGLADGRVCRLLDLGTGTAQIPIELIRRAQQTHPAIQLEITAVDLAAEMLVVAKQNVAAAGLADKIRLERLDAKALPYPDGRFTSTVSNSILHHIPEPHEALAEAVRITMADGLLFFRDLLRPTSDAAVADLVSLHAASANDHQRQLFAQSLRAALTVEEVRVLVETLPVETVSLAATSDRHWTWIARKRG